MSRLDPQSLDLRRLRRSAPVVESLESRQLLSTATASHTLSQKVHAEVITTKAESQKPVHVEKTTEKKAVEVKKTTVKKASTHHKTSEAVKSEAAPKLKQIKIKSKLIDIKAYQGVGSPTPVTGTPLTGAGSGQATYYPVAGALTPSQLETAYGVSQLPTVNQGQGETIAIVDELNDTSIISDANAYSAYYNLPQFNTPGGPTMTVDLDSDIAKVGSAKGTGVGVETSLDVEMVHAMAPQANILLVEVPATGTNAKAFQELLEGIQFAANQPGVVAVSLSYGLSESSIGNKTTITGLNSTYLATAPVTNVAVTVSTGDGSSPLFPATTPDVVAVGGTSLYLYSAQGQYFYETAWGGLAGAGSGGGGPSTDFGAPAFQSANGVTLSSQRTIPDISMVADPVTGVSVYDSFDTTTKAPDPWMIIGGTSAAAPLTAGVIGLAQQERLLASEPLLNSVEIDTAMYEAYNSPAYSTYFHDITLGTNKDVTSGGQTDVTGYNATTGYDEATGIGSPIASTLVPYLTNYVIGT
jgi:subtilase family serine protease